MATTDRILLLEPVGGIAGDMFLAAAIDLGLDLRTLEEILKTLRLPDFSLKTRRAESGGVSGTHLDVVVREEEAHHHHRGLSEILSTIEESGLSPAAKAGAKAVFSRLGRAEAKVHGVDLSDIRFHEVGAVDSLVDLCGAAVVLDLLGWPKTYSLPPELGVGVIKGAHGAMPVPPPAVVELLLGKPVQPGGPPGEAVTPTGAAILAEWADFGRPPTLSAEKVGYGVGTRTWPDRPNVLRMTLGKAASSPLRREDLLVLEANLDDSTGEMVARAIEAALEKGALDAWASPLVMKKGRPGLLLGALVEIAQKEAVAEAFFAETTTLGVRMYPVERMALEREMSSVETPYGTVRLKLARKDGRLTGIHPEYEDCLRRGKERGVSVREVMNSALAAHLKR